MISDRRLPHWWEVIGEWGAKEASIPERPQELRRSLSSTREHEVYANDEHVVGEADRVISRNLGSGVQAIRCDRWWYCRRAEEHTRRLNQGVLISHLNPHAWIFVIVLFSSALLCSSDLVEVGVNMDGPLRY